MIEARQEEVQRLGGLAAYRLQALQNLKLKTVIKVSRAACGRQDCDGGPGTSPAAEVATAPPDLPGVFHFCAASLHSNGCLLVPACISSLLQESHASPVHALAVNHTDTSMGNLFATVGKDQATVYDGEHMWDHVAVVVHFTNAPSEHAPGGELQAAAWLSAAGWSEHPAGDACLAVAGRDANISGTPAPLLLCLGVWTATCGRLGTARQLTMGVSPAAAGC